MKTGYNLISKETCLVCPRKAFIQGNIQGGIQKYRNLSVVCMNVLDKLPLTAKKNEISTQVDAEFDLQDNCKLLSFEATAERKKMKNLIYRYILWERSQRKNDIIAKNFKVVVEFDGEDVEVKVHRLFDRGSFYEAVLYAYKKPTIKKRGRKLQTRTDSSIKLLLLDLACKKKIEQLQKQHGASVIPSKATYGSIFFLKSNSDSGDHNPLDEKFDEKNDQVVSYTFNAEEKRNIILTYKDKDPDFTKEACNPSDCYNCPYEDICRTEFIPKKKINLKPVEIKPIDQIKMTPSQENFVNFRKGECRVNAVAGSGKTTVISLRTIALMEDGTKPEEILMVTFTDKACAEMRDRIDAYLKGSSLQHLGLDSSGLNILTFNGWGQEILSQNYERLGFQREPQVIDDITKKDIIISLLETHNKIDGLNYGEPFLNTINAMGAVTEMVKLIDTMKAAHVETEDDIKKIPKIRSGIQKESKTVLEIYNEYNQELINRNLLDFEDQLRLLLQLGENGVFETLPYKHIIVDEFQDSNPNQIDLICEIMEKNHKIESLAVVGDEMQAIYGFRDASPENLVEFNKFFPNMKDFYMEENFRSQKPIIQIANNILSQESRLKTAIKAQKDSSNVEPVLINKDSPKSEAEFFVKQIQDWLNEGIKPSEIAILGHTRSELRAYEKELEKAKIPTIMRVPEILKDSPYVKAILAFAKWIADPTQMTAFALYAKMMGENPYSIKDIQESADAVYQTFKDAQDDASKKGLFFSYLSNASADYMGEYFLHSLEENPTIHTFKELIQYCVKYVYYGITEPISTVKEAAEAVSLITIHSAKGLEYENCLLSMKKFKETAEEKRLLYVAVTRAKERLVITYPSSQSLVRLLRDQD